MSAHQGHRSWNAWNVSLWLNNDEGLYSQARGLAQHCGIDRAARYMARNLAGCRTPDGARYNLTCIREAMRGILD
jgi:hypothetical protein